VRPFRNLLCSRGLIACIEENADAASAKCRNLPRSSFFDSVVLQGLVFAMPSLKLAFPHQLGQPEAVARLKNLLTRVKDKYQDQVSDLKESWNENTLTFSFSTYGFKVGGDIVVEPSEVRLDGQIPFAAMMFKGKIENALRDQLERELA
jgi:hypothetical protein